MKQLISKYNHQDSLIIISLYPKKGELYSAGTSGVASYAKNVASHMSRKVVVLADCQGKKEMYEENNVLVYRCFKRNTPTMWFSILKALIQFLSVKNILIQLDFAVYGGVLSTSFVLPFLGFLKLMGYKTSVTMHHVVLNVFKLKGHVGLKDGVIDTIKGLIYNTLFHLFYLILGLFSKQIIVLEEVLKKRLSRVVNHNKVIAISHGVDNDEITSLTKSDARKHLGISQNEYVVLFFGFVNWFKGADCFVDTFKNKEKFLGKKVRFIIAGGESPTLKDRAYYQEYYSQVVESVKESKRIEITGYVPQEKIAVYFSACDLVVLPYRNFMTASGVLSLVFSYKKPFILSEELGKMFDAHDLKAALKSAGLRTSDLIFKLDKESCLKTTEKVLADGLKPRMIRMTEIIRGQRSYKNIAILYEKVLFEPAVVVSDSLALSYSQ